MICCCGALCGSRARYTFFYSYEDPAIRWLASSEQECSGLGENVDVFAGESELIGEKDTPVTPSMLSAPPERMLYLVIPEDCHDQFAFPQGIEEPLCDVIAYEAMLIFSSQRYGAETPESRAAQRYAREASRRARVTVDLYRELAALYARHERSGMSSESLLGRRAGIFNNAARALGWDVGVMNNVFFANAMTYSRHHAFVVDVFDALGGDLPRAVTFFRRVDAIKPSADEIMNVHGLTADSALDFVRAYEGAVVETTIKRLPSPSALVGRQAASRVSASRNAKSSFAARSRDGPAACSEHRPVRWERHGRERHDRTAGVIRHTAFGSTRGEPHWLGRSRRRHR